QGVVDQGDAMKARRVSASARLALLAAALWLVGCTTIVADAVNSTTESVSDAINRRDVKAHAVRSIKTLAINRVAVMPLIDAAPGGGEPLAPGAAEAMPKMPPTTIANLDENALQLGHAVSADGVIYGTVERYNERVGMDYSAASPAAVAF